MTVSTKSFNFPYTIAGRTAWLSKGNFKQLTGPFSKERVDLDRSGKAGSHRLVKVPLPWGPGVPLWIDEVAGDHHDLISPADVPLRFQVPPCRSGICARLLRSTGNKNVRAQSLHQKTPDAGGLCKMQTLSSPPSPLSPTA
jgi:hypothetical protein